jgi:NAD(P)-dependent dehydrogenase (short-subunit alcohol dehydrogenase family)
MRDFAGKVAVVTGAASGIGLGMATRFAQEGMKVVMADVEEPVLQASVTRLRQQEHDVLGVVTDVSSGASVEALRDKALEAYGKVHILCNNAGVGGRGASADIWGATEKDWQWALGVNLWGVVNGVKTFVPLMLEQGEDGHIVNTSSAAGVVPGTRVYSVTKHGVVALSEALFYDLERAGSKLHCSVLCPGVINTNIMYSNRNRPEALSDDPSSGDLTAEGKERADRIKHLAETQGMQPDQLADIVFNAIRDEQFWILTHTDYDDNIRNRMQGILNRTNPVPVENQLPR